MELQLMSEKMKSVQENAWRLPRKTHKSLRVCFQDTTARISNHDILRKLETNITPYNTTVIIRPTPLKKQENKLQVSYCDVRLLRRLN